MASVFENPEPHDLALVGYLNERHTYDGTRDKNWHIAVWQDIVTGQLYYAVETNGGRQFENRPFADCLGRDDLFPLGDADEFATFKGFLHFYWKRRHGQWSPDERHLRNRRSRLQRKVGRRLWHEPVSRERVGRQQLQEC
ncbi:hypothetical protein JNJ66_06515 [Candidatus Saccharibacteria bacterium]|nr:hypothetical protein [Candidatus Saccharibacteria bacterium]